MHGSPATMGATRDRVMAPDGALQNLDLLRFSEILGLPASAFSPQVREYIAATDFHFQVLTGAAREALLVEILETIDSGRLTRSGPHRQAIWDKGWSENLAEFLEQGLDIQRLLPKFVRQGAVKRLRGDYIVPSNPHFETACVTVLRDVVLRHYLESARSVFEFGCGTGLNLLSLARLFPDKSLIGLDWSQASCAIVNQLAATQGLQLVGRFFDMFTPDPTLDITPADAVYTIGALEQLGDQFVEFTDFLLDKGPAICINCETMDELYDRGDLADYAARQYSKARNYLRGFLTHLRALERAGRIDILQVQRTFGSQYHEGYSFVVWRVRPTTRPASWIGVPGHE